MGIALLALSVAFRDAPISPAAAQSSVHSLLTADQVVDGLRAAGLSVQDVRAETVGSARGPSGPPATEREARGFALGGPGARGGRILVFDNDHGLRQKATWFRRAHATIIVHANVIIWLDPDIERSEAARFHHALQAMR